MRAAQNLSAEGLWILSPPHVTTWDLAHRWLCVQFSLLIVIIHQDWVNIFNKTGFRNGLGIGGFIWNIRWWTIWNLEVNSQMRLTSAGWCRWVKPPGILISSLSPRPQEAIHWPLLLVLSRLFLLTHQTLCWLSDLFRLWPCHSFAHPIVWMSKRVTSKNVGNQMEM